MEKKEISMQLYTTRHFQPYDPILKFLSDSGIVNIELFGLESMNIDEFKSMMDQSNITSKSTHVSYESLSDPSDIINRANKMNIKHIIVPAPPARKDAEFKNTFDMNEEEWIDFGKKLSSYVTLFEDAGLTLGYHNHSYEFKPLPSGKLPIECMMDQNEDAEQLKIIQKKYGFDQPILNQYLYYLNDFFYFFFILNHFFWYWSMSSILYLV